MAWVWALGVSCIAFLQTFWGGEPAAPSPFGYGWFTTFGGGAPAPGKESAKARDRLTLWRRESAERGTLDRRQT